MEPPNLFYRGSSMLGTFKPGDKLVMEKVPLGQIKKGDLIIFSKESGETDDFIVHRVVSITAKGLVTRGDNCFGNDRDMVVEENVIGRVVDYDRQGKIHRTRNGRAGFYRARALHGRLIIFKLIRRIFRGPYLKIRGSELIARLWRPEIEIHLFETSDGPIRKFVHHGRTVGTLWQSRDRIWLKHPYDLLIKKEAQGDEEKEVQSKEYL